MPPGAELCDKHCPHRRRLTKHGSSELSRCRAILDLRFVPRQQFRSCSSGGMTLFAGSFPAFLMGRRHRQRGEEVQRPVPG